MNMSRTRTSTEDRSLLKAIDGSHLKWNEFRQDVLQPFGIRFADAQELFNVPPTLSTRLQKHVNDLPRFDQQRQRWQDQVAIGQGFASPTIFPPNILPQTCSPTKLLRFLLPKMSREALPRRARSANCLFELPSSKPIYAAAFATEAFSESEHLALPSSLSPVGTLVDFTNGDVGAGRIFHCPFLVFERCQSTASDDIQNALNMCAISGAQCVRGMHDIVQRANKKQKTDVCTFSCLVNDKMAIINIHTVDEHSKYAMSPLSKFDLVIDEHFNTFQAWIEAIEDWASSCLLPQLKDSLTKLTLAGETPPASPMPSLALSIDTEIGAVPGLMQALRRTFPAVPWQGHEIMDSPINSSVAHCGTPAEGRRTQSLALSTPASSTFGNLMLRRGYGRNVVSPINTRNPVLPFTPARPSPFSPRHAANMPMSAIELGSESPCRPGTLSPNTPPPDQPWAAKSPMLVLQKRVDVAMNEVQDLRSQVEMLQSELAVKNQLIAERLSAMEATQKVQKIKDEKTRAKLLQMEAKKCDLEADLEEVVKQSWISFAWKPEGWEVLVEQFLFVIALAALLIMSLMACRSLFPIVSQVPALVGSRLSSLFLQLGSSF